MSDVARITLSTSDAVTPPVVPATTVAPTTNGAGVTARADETNTPPVEKPGDRPAWLPEKFKSPEDMARAYAELETKQGQGTKPPEATPPTTTTTADPNAALAAKGIDLKALQSEYLQNGSLSAESITKLGAAGISPAQVDEYIAGQTAVAAQIRTDLAKVAGGEEKLDRVLDWAKSNVTQAEADAFDAALATGNPALVKLALSGIVGQYDAKFGNAPELVTGVPVPGTHGPKPFASKQEIEKAFGDPRYLKGDRAYIKEVEQRMGATTLWNRGR